MQWDGSMHAGFTSGTPWLPVSRNFREFNVETEKANPHSLWNLYRALIRLRRATPALQIGTYEALKGVPADCLVYLRRSPNRGDENPEILIAVNFTPSARIFSLSKPGSSGRLLLSTLDETALEKPVDLEKIRLEADEAVVVSLR